MARSKAVAVVIGRGVLQAGKEKGRPECHWRCWRGGKSAVPSSEGGEPGESVSNKEALLECLRSASTPRGNGREEEVGW